MTDSLLVPRRFNGPLENGQGGYSAGLIAQHIGGGPAEVTLRRPVPLDTRLALVRTGDDSVQAVDGEVLIAEGRTVSDLELEVPVPVTREEARRATARYRGRSDGMFSRCFVCGRARHDAFGVFAGAVHDQDLVASPWIPPDWSADAAGAVRPEFLWAVLDCPTFFALYAEREELPLSVLGRLTARVEGPARAGEEYVVIAWPIEVDGRKHHAGAAVLSGDGKPLAVARALLIEQGG